MQSLIQRVREISERDGRCENHEVPGEARRLEVNRRDPADAQLGGAFAEIRDADIGIGAVLEQRDVERNGLAVCLDRLRSAVTSAARELSAELGARPDERIHPPEKSSLYGSAGYAPLM